MQEIHKMISKYGLNSPVKIRIIILFTLSVIVFSEINLALSRTTSKATNHSVKLKPLRLPNGMTLLEAHNLIVSKYLMSGENGVLKGPESHVISQEEVESSGSIKLAYSFYDKFDRIYNFVRRRHRNTCTKSPNGMISIAGDESCYQKCIDYNQRFNLFTDRMMELMIKHLQKESPSSDLINDTSFGTFHLKTIPYNSRSIHACVKRSKTNPFSYVLGALTSRNDFRCECQPKTKILVDEQLQGAFDQLIGGAHSKSKVVDSGKSAKHATDSDDDSEGGDVALETRGIIFSVYKGVTGITHLLDTILKMILHPIKFGFPRLVYFFKREIPHSWRLFKWHFMRIINPGNYNQPRPKLAQRPGVLDKMGIFHKKEQDGRIPTLKPGTPIFDPETGKELQNPIMQGSTVALPPSPLFGGKVKKPKPQ